jgi:hypothetical protein
MGEEGNEKRQKSPKMKGKNVPRRKSMGNEMSGIQRGIRLD